MKKITMFTILLSLMLLLNGCPDPTPIPSSVWIDGSMHYTDNNGASWVEAFSDKGFSGIEYAADGNVYIWTNSEMYKSINDGLSWEPIHKPDDMDVFFADSDGVLYSAYSGKVSVSTNGGSSWRITSKISDDDNIRINEIKNLNGNLIACTSRGVFLSIDQGASWIIRENELRNLNVYELIQAGSKYFAATYNGVFVSTDGENYEETLLSGGSVTSIRSSSGGLNLFAINNGEMMYSDDGGETWYEKNDALTNMHINVIEVNSNDELFVIAKTSGWGDYSIYYSDDQFKNIITVNNNLPEGNPIDIMISESDRLFVILDGYLVD